MISLYITYNVIGYFSVAGFKEHKNGATTELKLCCELPYEWKKNQAKQKPTPQVFTSFVLVSKESCIYSLFLYGTGQKCPQSSTTSSIKLS